MTKANLRDPNNFLSAVGEEFGDVLFNNKGKGLRNLSNNLKGSQAEPEVHALSMVSIKLHAIYVKTGVYDVARKNYYN